MKKLFLFVLLLTPMLLAAEEALFSAPAPDGVRPGGTLNIEAPAPEIAPDRRGIERQTRSWPEQPPMIPHTVRNYQIDKNFNQCLSCHSRARTVESGAPMVSITHYWDRDHQPLAAVSPRRYFCTQCHVPQHDIAPIVSNRFMTIDAVIQQSLSSEAE